MTIEEKAKRYDRTIERAKITLDCCGSTSIATKNTIYDILPELKESEDEKVRKWIIDDIRCNMDNEPLENSEYKKQAKKAIAWLIKQGEPTHINPSEFDLRLNKLLKQFETLPKEELASSLSFYLNVVQNDGAYKADEKKGEQKPTDTCDSLIIKSKEFPASEKRDFGYFNEPTDKVEPKFKVGDWVITPNNATKQIKRVTFGNYCFTDETFYNIIDTDNKGHPWTIKDAKDGNVLAGSKDDVILIFRGIGNTEWNDVIDYHCYYDCYQKDFIIQEDVEYWGNVENNQLVPATKEQRELLFQKMKEAGYKWDDKKKELKEIEQEPTEWSEEDEYMLNETIQHLEELIRIDKAKHCSCDVQYYQRDIDWLKSLKDRV